MKSSYEIYTCAFMKSKSWKALRQVAIQLLGNQCLSCKRPNLVGKDLQVDHVIPRSKKLDLQLSLSNLQILCAYCNGYDGKGNKPTDFRTAEQRSLMVANEKIFVVPPFPTIKQFFSTMHPVAVDKMVKAERKRVKRQKKKRNRKHKKKTRKQLAAEQRNKQLFGLITTKLREAVRMVHRYPENQSFQQYFLKRCEIHGLEATRKAIDEYTESELRKTEALLRKTNVTQVSSS